MFSKYELYTTAGSMYYYTDTDVLRNHLGLRDAKSLREAEEEITAVKQYQLLREPLKGRFSKTHLRRIHRFLFEDIYPFAGHLRREQIGKADTWFDPPQLINRNLTNICNEIIAAQAYRGLSREEFIDRLAYVMAELNRIHPFREGNGRTIREFIRLLALHNNLNLNWGRVSKDDLLFSSISSVSDYHALIPVLDTCISEL